MNEKMQRRQLKRRTTIGPIFTAGPCTTHLRREWKEMGEGLGPVEAGAQGQW